MKLLLDSYILLWWQGRDRSLPDGIIAAISGAETVLVSAATTWELDLKVQLGKLRLPEPVEDGVLAAGFEPLPIRFEHTRRAVGLPAIHRDPFDRMLVAQALVEGATLVTHDSTIARYEVPLLFVR